MQIEVNIFDLKDFDSMYSCLDRWCQIGWFMYLKKIYIYILHITVAYIELAQNGKKTKIIVNLQFSQLEKLC